MRVTQEPRLAGVVVGHHAALDGLLDQRQVQILVAGRPIALAGDRVHADGKGEHGGIAAEHCGDVVVFEDFLQAVHQPLAALFDGFQDRLGLHQVQRGIGGRDARLIVRVRPAL